MYGKSAIVGAGTGAGTAGLAFTGLNAVYLVLAAFALLSVGIAIVRLIPLGREED